MTKSLIWKHTLGMKLGKKLKILLTKYAKSNALRIPLLKLSKMMLLLRGEGNDF